MKTKRALSMLAGMLALFASSISAQSPNLRSASNFVLFSSVGAVGSTGISHITGNVGTNTGAVTGFGNVDGVMHNADAVTAQAAIDLNDAWYHLDTISVTATHMPVLGNGETLYAGVYSIAGAGSLVANLTLDGQGNSNAVFIFKTSGALTSAATSSVTLINGALACNVFWKAEGGAISLATLTTMRGTLIAHPGAIALGAGCTLEGRALSTTGAVTVYGTLAYIPLGCSRPVLTGPIAPPLGMLRCFSLFSSFGTLANTGVSHIDGDVGSNNSSPAGYNQAHIVGTLHVLPDPITAQAAVALPSVKGYLDTISPDIELLYPAQFGNDLVITPHTYLLNAAASLTNLLYLNAEGNPDARFIIRINGALTTSVGSEVRLINGAQAKNVYWKVNGAVIINNNSVFPGTIVTTAGAFTLNAGVVIEGRVLTSTGTIASNSATINAPWGCGFLILPLNLVYLSGVCTQNKVLIKWATASEIDNDYYAIERSSEGTSWNEVGRVKVPGNSSDHREYSFADKAGKGSGFYRLRLKATGGKITYSKVIAVKDCKESSQQLVVYPTPSRGLINVVLKDGKEQFRSAVIYNSTGQKVFSTTTFQPTIDISTRPDGVYFLHVRLAFGYAVQSFLIER